MADYDDEQDDNSQDRQAATTDPAIQAFREAVPDEAAEKPWVNEVTTRLNDWVQQRNMADANEAAANQYVANIGEFKSGLVNMVTQDPTAYKVAMDIVPPTVHGMLPYDYMHPDTHEDTHSALTGDIQGQIAHAAVASMARRDGDSARKMLDDLGDHFSDQQKDELTGYIGAHEVARAADGAAAQREAAMNAQRVQAATQHGYASALLDANTGQIRFPQGWAQKLLDDPNLAPQDRGELMHLAGRLQTGGDGKRDPDAIREILNDIANGNMMTNGAAVTPNELMRATGGKDSHLKLQDFVWLNGLVNTESTDGQIAIRQLATTVSQASRVIYGADGENTGAGQKAFGRFMDWFIPAYQKAGPAGLDPTSDSYLFNGTNVAAFKPTNEDLVFGARSRWGAYAQPSRGLADQAPINPINDPRDRITLQDIFAGPRPTPTPGEDVAIKPNTGGIPRMPPKQADPDRPGSNLDQDEGGVPYSAGGLRFM